MIATLALLLGCTEPPAPPPPPLTVLVGNLAATPPLAWQQAERVGGEGSAAIWVRAAPPDPASPSSLVLDHTGRWAWIEARTHTDLWDLDAGRWLRLPDRVSARELAGSVHLTGTGVHYGLLPFPLDTAEPVPRARFSGASVVWLGDHLYSSAFDHTWHETDPITGVRIASGTITPTCRQPDDRLAFAPHGVLRWPGIAEANRGTIPLAGCAPVRGENPDPTGTRDVDPDAGVLVLVEDGVELRRPLQGVKAPLQGWAWSGSGEELVAVTEQELVIWRVPNGRRQWSVAAPPHPTGATSAPDGQRLAVWTGPGRVQVFSRMTRQVVCEYQVDAPIDDVVLGPADHALIRTHDLAVMLDVASCTRRWSQGEPPRTSRGSDDDLPRLPVPESLLVDAAPWSPVSHAWLASLERAAAVDRAGRVLVWTPGSPPSPPPPVPRPVPAGSVALGRSQSTASPPVPRPVPLGRVTGCGEDRCGEAVWKAELRAKATADRAAARGQRR